MDLNDIQDLLIDGTWLGRLRVANHLFAEFQPIAELADGKWMKVENRIAKFPTQGFVRAKQADLGQSRAAGSLWVFGCRPSGMERHQCLAIEPERAIPVVDLSSKPLADAKHQLLEVGVPLPEHQGRHAVVLLQDDTFCALRFDPHGRLFVARLPADGVVELRKADPNWKSAYPVGNALFLPTRGIPSGEVIARFDWSSDRDFLLKFLERYRAAVSGYYGLEGKSSELTVRKIEQALLEGRLTGAGATQLEAVVERMRVEWSDTSRALTAIEQMGELLLESEPGKRLLKEVVERRRDELAVGIETKLRSEIEERLSSCRDELATLERQVETETSRRNDLRDGIMMLSREKADADKILQKSQTELKALEANSKELRHATEQLRAQSVAMQASLDDAVARRDALDARIDSLRKALVRFRETAQREFEATGANNESILQALATRLESQLGAEGEPATPPLPFLPAATPPWWCSTSTDEARRISKVELEERVAQEAKGHGVLAEDLHLVDLFARSGELVLLLGPQMDQAMGAYARAVSGGHIRTHALDPSAIGLDDLWRVPATGRPTAFALAWHQAQVRSDAAVLLCLRNLDASPFHLWLASLVAALRSPNRPRNLFIVATDAAVAGQGEEYPAAESLRHHLVAIEPRVDPHSHLAEVIYDEPLPPPTLLNGPWESGRIVKATFKAISQNGRDAEVVRRALRLAGTGTEGQSLLTSRLASVWSQYLVDGRPEALPAALSCAHERLKAIHVQH